MMKQRSNTSLFSGDILARRLQALSFLSPTEMALVLSTQQRPKLHGVGSQITPDSEGTPHPRLIVSGWACRPRILSDGRCQMLAILLPGDIVGDGGDHRPLELTPSVALTAVRTISIKPMFDAIARNPDQYRALASGLGQISRLSEVMLLDHVVRLGRQTAVQRVAHCLLELHDRLKSIDFVRDGCFSMPLTQEVLGDALGLSLVHVNRTLSQLKRDGLIEMKSGIICVPDVARLSFVADYSRAGFVAPAAPEARGGEWAIRQPRPIAALSFG